ncbi:hypothetical protein LHL20_13395 [Alteromonas sp. McT4-15]|jgi:hypothetical protein|uniref:hypothetical protein n=1 Tax=Alteromonas sp. McT4-15 TaxID=2881256 RepID=UPI0012E5763C|nr:hypothetical protein [Alteromonas sp. McT4-15]MCB4437221.1 hypothetical protein [Alteromonas sp. McT4-15]GFD88834.1 hypothetical protein KUL152_10600 [Tenacibaculum sp. KUL152]
MTSQIGNLISVVLVWALVAYIFVFGFAQIKWSGWEGALPWLCGVVALFTSAGFTTKWLMAKPVL